MSMFRAKKLDLGCFVNIRTIRDHTKRQVFMQNEPERQALRYIIQNTTLPGRVRAEAQLQLGQMHCYTRPTQIKNRCILGGKARGVFRDFKMTRPSFLLHPNTPLPRLRPAATMFRRRWSGLPKDPVFSSNLKDLGYFVNDQDEIRNIKEPEYYFKYYLTKNGRVNDRQRFHFNEAIRDIVHGRLEKEGLKEVLLPLGVEPTSPNVSIFTSANLASASRVIVIFGEPSQDLGNLALRVVNGPGGINKGSMVSVVQEINRQRASPSDDSPPGIIIANTGELWWWPEGKKALSPTSAMAVPRKSMVHHGRANNPRYHSIPNNETPEAHIAYVLNEVIPSLLSPNARLDIIGIGLGADHATRALDTPETWSALDHRINTLSLLGSTTSVDELSHQPFKEFLPRRARAYITDEAPALTPVAQPGGNPNTASFTQHGCTVYSSGEVYLVECMLVTSHVLMLDWVQEVALAGPDYRHPEVVAVDPHVPTEEEWAAGGFDEQWENMPEFAKPSIGYAMAPEDHEHCQVLEGIQKLAVEKNEQQSDAWEES
ncbi:Arb2 domain-containing protein [Colletotrichum tamarilloi]|uniref:Arb2 domain-containing protein n=1 Tax=Colletotrichum tamarilloi TaxID=1209934 RepID=A0ABQ9R2Z9_9PEZI|nr:Arb2 domain-containing protein [Colletotrichum tamarilloi]KAK1493027.1 Arb2 domain-containing protein [Colletotrichum tamarilloi]